MIVERVLGESGREVCVCLRDASEHKKKRSIFFLGLAARGVLLKQKTLLPLRLKSFSVF